MLTRSDFLPTIVKRKTFVFACVCALLCINQPLLAEQSKSARTQAALKAHIEFLADDLLQGRDTGTAEYEIAARYVASHYAQFGLKPLGDKVDGQHTWFQSVPFVESTLVEGSAKMAIHTKAGETIELTYPDDFMVGANGNSTADSIRGEVVFVGYGIVSEPMNHDDYAGLNVKGKIVAYLTGRPKSFPSEQGAHLSSGTQKARAAAERGAIGTIVIHTPERDKVRTYESSTRFAGRPSMTWRKKDGGVYGSFENLTAGAYVSKQTGAKLFEQAGFDIEKVFAEIAEDKVPVGFNLGVEVSIARQSTHKDIVSSNVVGVLEGSDPELKHEYVLYTAHLDHIGVRDAGTDEHGHAKDGINNGALDNASGVAVMLETARQFSEGKRPKRSMLFVAVTGEEKGLHGSNYFAHYPTVDIRSIVANINLDMPLILYPFADVIAFGAQHSTMADYVERAAAKEQLSLSPDPMPEQAIFVRSDHYSLVKQGVPAIFLVPGHKSKDPEIDGAKVFGTFLSKHYHKPSDDLSLEINYQAGETFVRINKNIGEEIANSKQKPQWHEGNFFGESFKRD